MCLNQTEGEEDMEARILRVYMRYARNLGKADLHHAGVDGGGSVSVHVGLAQRLIQNGLLNHDLHSFHVHLQKNNQVQTSKKYSISTRLQRNLQNNIL
jgi:hypothetical protein